MFIISYVSVALGVLGLLIGGALVYAQHRNRQALYLGLFTASAGGWALVNGLADGATHVWSVVLLSGLAVITFNFFASFFLCFTLSFVGRGRLLPAWQWFAACSPSAILALFAFSSYSVVSVTILPGMPAEMVPGPLYIIGPTFVYLAFAVSYVLLAAHYRRTATHREKRQIWYIVVGSAVTLVGVTLFDIVLPLGGEVRFFSVGPLTTAFLVVLTSYAIFRHELAELTALIQRSVLYVIVAAVVFVVYAVLLLALERFFPHDTDGAAIVSAGIALVLGVFCAPFFERWFRARTDRFFFKQGYDYADAVRSLSRSLHESLALADVARSVEGGFVGVLRADAVNLRWGAAPVDERTDAYRVIAPVVAYGTTVAVLELDPKRSGDPYTAQDRKLVRTVLYQLTTAIERALLHEQVRTHAAELEVRVRERTADVARLQEAQAQMLVEMSHALQTPLAVLKNEIEAARDKLGEGAPMSTVTRSIDDLSRFVYGLLKLARLEAAGPQPAAPREAVNLSELVDGIVEYLTVLAQAQGVAVHAAVAPGIVLSGNRGQLEEVVVNLMSNALKHLRRSPTRRLEIQLDRSGDQAILRVIDTGTGIAPDELPRVFDTFYRGTAQNATGMPSTGLGLAIAHRVVHAHGGTITVASVLGQGSTFTVTVPLPASGAGDS